MNKLQIKSMKSKVAPKGFAVNRNYLQMGDKYIKVATVMNTPKNYYAGILAVLSSNPNIKVGMMVEQTSENIPNMIKGEVNRLRKRYNETTDMTIRADIQQKMQAMDTMVNNLVARNDRTYNIVINILVQGDTLQQLNDSYQNLKMQLMMQGWQLQCLMGIQEKLYKRTSMWFHNDNFSKEMKNNIGVLLPSLNLAAMYPFIFDTLDDPQGVLLGCEQYNGGKIMFDQFIYENDFTLAKADNRLNGNMVLVGTSGSGKTTALSFIQMQHMLHKRKIIWIDPENKNRNMILRANGSYFNMGTKNARINIFDLKPISCDEDEEVDMYDTELAIYNVVEDIKIVLKYLYPTIKDETLSVIGGVAVETYKRVGITKEKSFKNLNYNSYPTFTNFQNTVKEYIEMFERAGQYGEEYKAYKDLELKIRPLTVEYSAYFDGQTTVNVSENANPFIGFGTKIFFSLTEGLKDALMHIILQYSWSLCLDDSCYSVFCVDEAHLYILAGETAKMLEQFVRRSRKYKNATIIATQEPHDFADDKVISSGKAMFNSSTYKVILHLEKDGVEDLKKLTTLTSGEVELIERFKVGEAILVAGSKRIPISIKATDDMFRMMA